MTAGGEEARPRWGLIPRLFRTSAFRYTLIYTAFFALSILGIGYFVYASTIGQAMERLDEELIAEIFYLAEQNQRGGNDGLAGLVRVQNEVARLKVADPAGLYLIVLAGPPLQVLETNLPNAPAEMIDADGMFEFDYLARRRQDDGTMSSQYRRAAGRTAEFLYRRTDGGRDRAVLLVGRDIEAIDRIRADGRAVIIRLGGVTLLLGLFLGSVYASTFLRRVDGISRTVNAIRDGDLSRRVALTGSDDEFDKLSGNINAMLDQIERLMTGMRQVSDNIAHDLRSPLTRIKARLESALTHPGADREEVLGRTADDVERLLATFNALLSITRLESGEGGGAKVPVDVAAVAAELAELYEPAAEDAGFVLKATIKPVPPILGSRELVSQLIANLLDNALKYARRGADDPVQPEVELTVAPRADGGGVLLSVMDNGPGVAEADRDRILRRFVRLERSRSTEGNGLGLSLVAAIARRHDARISIGRGLPHSREDRALLPTTAYGLGVRVAFPEAPPPSIGARTTGPAAKASVKAAPGEADARMPALD